MGYFYGGTSWGPVPLSRRQIDHLGCRQIYILKNSDLFLDLDSRSFLYCYQAEILLPPRLKTFSQISLPVNGHEIFCCKLQLLINFLLVVYVDSVVQSLYRPRLSCTIYFSQIEKAHIITHNLGFTGRSSSFKDLTWYTKKSRYFWGYGLALGRFLRLRIGRCVLISITLRFNQ